MKTKLFNFLAAFILLLLCGCATTKPIPDRELVADPQFKYWFNIRGLGGDADNGEIQAIFPSSELLGKPLWTIAQWGSRYNLADPKITEKRQISPNIFQLQNKSMGFTVNSRKGELDMGVVASACYEKPRMKDEPWPHLLISTELTDVRVASGFCKVENIKKLRLNVDAQLINFKDSHPNPDPDLHSAQFFMHIIVQNLTLGDDGYGDMLWFGIPIFDNRKEIIPETFSSDSAVPDATGKFRFNLGHAALRPKEATFFREGKIVAGDNAQVIPTQVDIIPWIHYAFQLARRNGFLKTTSFRDLYVSGMNLGWEMPGTYDGTMRISNLSLIAEY